jgi:general secretion pathway protein I
LLEVIVAIAILGLGLTTILSAQAGLFASSQRGANMTRAANLARCKMSEVEVVLARDGFPLTDEKDDGHCCENEDNDGFICHYLIETIKLPDLNSQDGGLDGGTDADGGLPRSGGFAGGLNFDAGAGAADGLMGMGAMGQGMSAMGMSGMGMSGMGMSGMGMSGMGMSGMGASGGGLDSIASMALTMVYPTVKPMFEASIRRVMIKVTWHEGSSERIFEVGQYLTNPQQGGMLPGMPGYDPAAAAMQMMGLPTGTTGTGTGTGATTNKPKVGL